MKNQALLIDSLVSRDTDQTNDNNPDNAVLPAFKDTRTGRVEIARNRVGLPASCHLIDWLPREWARTITDTGRVSSLRPEIVQGFVFKGVFYTREELSKRRQ